VDDCCHTHDSMAAGAGDRLYDGLFYSYPAGRCHHRHTDPSFSGAKIIAIWAIAREVKYLERKWSAGQDRSSRIRIPFLL